MNDKYVLAVEEYLDNIRKQTEILKSRGILEDVDVKEQEERTYKKINELIEANEPYAVLLMDLDHIQNRNNKMFSLTEIAKRENEKNPGYVIQSWLRDKDTLRFFKLWETDNNPNFDSAAADELFKKIDQPSFTLTAKQWITGTNAIGLESRQGKGGGTLAHQEIAIDFITWLYPEKRYKLVKMITNRLLL